MPFYHLQPRDRGPLRPCVPSVPAAAGSKGAQGAQGREAPGGGAVLQRAGSGLLPGQRPVRAASVVEADGPPARPGSLTEYKTRVAARVGYAVVDLETTGLSPSRDSILEVAVVLTDPAGTPQTSWATLVNPGAGTDVGPTHIHGLVAHDLVDAPSLDDVADRLVADLAGRVVVAHNARFDVGFLTQALGRRRLLDRGARVPRVCTMEWARYFMTTPSRRLTTCCEVAGVEIGRHHSALDDALAAAGLLRHYMRVGRERGEEPVAWAGSLLDASRFTGWHWDDERARGAEEHLVARQRPGALRALRAPSSPGTGLETSRQP